MSTWRTRSVTGAMPLAAAGAAVATRSTAGASSSDAVVAQAGRAKAASSEKGSKIRRIDILRVAKARTIAGRFSEAIRLPDSGRRSEIGLDSGAWLLSSRRNHLDRQAELAKLGLDHLGVADHHPDQFGRVDRIGDGAMDADRVEGAVA